MDDKLPPAPLDPTLDAILRFAPPGHFYSPHPSVAALESGGHNAAMASAKDAAGIDLDPSGQLDRFRTAATVAPVGPWKDGSHPGLRHYYGNHFFRFGDSNAVFHAALQHRPARVIEIGSGFSTACWLDSLDTLGLATAIECIEPYPDRVHQMCTPADLASRITLHERPLQAVPRGVFDQLGRDDVLFIDSTHVSKCGSDVNLLFFSILPRLSSGVVVHIHDIFWPFEYPLQWYREGRAWNEAYLLRTFLQFNCAFKILRFNSYLAQEFPTELAAVDPRYVSDAGGSIWLRRC